MTEQNQNSKIIGVADLDQLSLLDRAEKCSNWISNLGTSVSRHNRISRICSAIMKGKDDIIDYKESRFPLVRQAHKDLIELSLIIDVFGTELVELYPDKLNLLFKDEPIPSKNSKNTKGYDTQFELFIGAVCKRAGMKIKIGQQGEPDWLVSTPAFSLAIEAKRSKSMEGIEGLVRKAGNQIHKSGRGGVVMLDATHAFNPNDVQINVPANDEMIRRAHSQNIDSAMSSCLKNLHAWLQEKSVGNIYINQTVFRPGAKDPKLNLSWAAYSLWAIVNVSSHRAPWPYREFEEIFWAAMPRL